MSLQIIQADLDLPAHQQAVLELIDAYAQDPMGDGKPLSADVRERLIPALKQHPTTLILLALDDGAAVGIAVCFRGFSTFAARPLINIHDLAVLPTHRGQGIASKLLDAVEVRARELGCCKLTLEVFEHNHAARRVYASLGFEAPALQADSGGMRFLSKNLSQKPQ